LGRTDLLKKELKEELFDFCCQMLVTRDYDPNYFAVKGFAENVGMTWDEIYSFCFVFNGFYHFGSAQKFLENPKVDLASLAYGKSRRGFRGNDKVRNFIYGGASLKKEILKHRDGGENGWSSIYDLLLKISGCGHWSAFYLCDMFKVILGFKITSPNVGFLSTGGSNRGPISGLAFISKAPEEDLRKDVRLHRRIYKEMLEGVPFEGMEQFESILCNYLSLHKKMYYVGRDIDRQIAMMEGLGPEWWNARKKYFPDALLGEKHGWTDIRKDLMGVFESKKEWKQP
jgi:hypothetical protein